MEIRAGTITGGTIRTAESGPRIEIGGDTTDRIRFHNLAGLDGGVIWIDSDSVLHISAAQGVEINARGLVIGDTPDWEGNTLLIRNVTDNADIPTPPAGYVAIYFNSTSGNVVAKNSAGNMRAMTNNPL